MSESKNTQDLADLITSPFLTSFVAAARPGERRSGNQQQRVAGWAQQAVSSIGVMTGYKDRSYHALNLTGTFYDPKGNGPTVTPHLEIPDWRIGVPAEDFPTRLALAGNGLDFPYWVKDEVLAVRRGLFINPTTDIRNAADILFDNSTQLQSALYKVLDLVSNSWKHIESLLVSADEELCDSVCGNFSEEEVAAFFPAAKKLHLSVIFDTKLKERNGIWATRRVGVWQVNGVDAEGERFSFGTITPRLTANSQFKDPLFKPNEESPASVLVRALVMSRIADRHLAGSEVTVRPVTAAKAKPSQHFCTTPAKVGAKLPEASLLAVVNFLQSYSDPKKAWEALAEFSTRTEMLLTVTEDGFEAAFRRAQRFLARNETLEREDINVILPLGWRADKVLRVSFSKTPLK